MKKIYWITGDYFLDVDMSLIPFLKSKNIDVEWTILKTLGSKVEIVNNLSSNMDICVLHSRNMSINIIKEYVALIKKINKIRPDVLYVNFFGMPFFYPILYWMLNRNIKIVHAAHNVIPYDGWPNKRVMTWYVNYVLKGRAVLHIFSEHLKYYLNSKYPNKKYFYAPLVIKDYGCVKSDNYNFDLDKLKILFFGNVKNNKRLDLAIKSLCLLPDYTSRKIQLIIAGSCDNQEYYSKMIDNHPSIITFFERIPDNHIPELFTKVDFLLLPYENVAQSGPLMIAFNYNLPVIASDIDGFKEHITHGINGLLFRNGDVDSLREVLVEAARMDNHTYEQMKNEIHRNVISKYSLEAVSLSYIDFFKMI
ncbi:glycosyl transferase group 1 [Paludibacter propionicigenes WB4]|uniref:Glycosyl transferase group 1 n=1 Tax=Paludibacter propionicigenes (strain DSM 17365 / JCM 13257 / WB4) TaxID=694427 RepID=E4T1H1_PALPW|nr:glycosyltransferase family 4 protein [Paludibacter propionicigenes]ADQ78565.1 glycosyl transferase group 1 [Paludibacter propionicigenes WB4]